MLIEPIIYQDQQTYFKIKINAGKQIFKSGGIVKISDLEYTVSSATIANEKYKVFFNYDENRFNCECMSFISGKKYNYWKCKHIYAILHYMKLII